VRFPLAGRLNAARQVIADAELIEVHRERLAAHPEGFGEDLRARLENAARATLDEYVRARRERELMRRAMRDLFGALDALLLPAYPCVAAPVETTLARVNGREQPFLGLGRPLTGPHNLTGFPALAVPTGFSPEGLPVAMQIVGPPWEEARILRIAHAYEEAAPEVRSRRPGAAQEAKALR